jgi:hypothetical protein
VYKLHVAINIAITLIAACAHIHWAIGGFDHKFGTPQPKFNLRDQLQPYQHPWAKNKQIFLPAFRYTADKKPRPQETAGLVHEARALTENILK